MLVEVMKQRDALRTQLDALQQGQHPASSTPCTDRHAPASPSPTTAAADPALAAALAAAAPGGAVLLALANAAYAAGPGGGLVGTWAGAAAKAGAPALLFALDDDAAAAATGAGVPAFRVDLPIPAAQRTDEGSAPPSNHAVSSLKYGLARRVLALGYTLLFSDVDVLTFADPFSPGNGLFPLDTDVAAASDGWDPSSAYGWDDVLDEPGLGWARYVHSTRIMHLNSGLWAARPSPAADAALGAVAARVAAEPGWDQAIFNQVLLTPSHEGYTAPGATVRVLSPTAFMNSRVLWTTVREEAARKKSVISRPTMLHANYHPDKAARLAAAAAFFEGGGDVAALDVLPLKGGGD
jgi:arabinosyltransferase